MKIAILAAAAGLVALTGVAPAAAQRVVHTERTVVHDRHEHRGVRTRQVCHWETRHHHRARVCRTVRGR